MDDSQVRLHAIRSFLSQQSGMDESEFQVDAECIEEEYVDDERERLERIRRILAQNQESKSILSPIPKAIQRRSLPPKTPPPPPFSASSGLTRTRRDISTISARDADSKTSGSASPHENDRPIHENTSAVFDRLYALHKNKKRSQDSQKKNNEFRPKIDKNSRKLAMQTERVSLYERALQQRFRQESEREMKERQEREDRSKPKTLQTSQQLAWNRLRREVEQLFLATIQSVREGEMGSDDVLMALDREEFAGILKHLNLQEVNVELYEMLSGEGDRLVHLDTFCSYLKHISFPSSDEDAPKDEFSMKVKRLLVGRKAVPSTASLEKVYREVAVELPFAPQITEKSRQLDEKRYQRMGIDPSLPRSEKIHAELRLQAEKKETNKTVHSKRELEPCTFHPKTNKTSATAYHRPASPPAASSEYARKPIDVGSRLYKDSKERDARLMRKKEERQNAALTEEIAECTFRPAINSRPRSQTGTSLKSQENSLRVKAFQMSVERLREWREKHVTKVDTADLAYIAKMRQEEGGSRGGVRSSEKPARTSGDSSFLARHRTKAIIFEAEVALPSGLTSFVQVRNGDDLVRVAAAFAKKHGLDKIEETSLLKSLQANVPQVSNEELSVMSRDEFIDDQSETPSMYLEQERAEEELQQYNEESDCLVLDVLVRPGETYELTISSEDDPVQVAHDFADDVGMEDEARDRLIESLMGLRI